MTGPLKVSAPLPAPLDEPRHGAHCSMPCALCLSDDLQAKARATRIGELGDVVRWLERQLCMGRWGAKTNVAIGQVQGEIRARIETIRKAG